VSKRQTHWSGCWESDTHGDCARIHARAAVNHIHKLQSDIAAVERERDELREALRELIQADDECLTSHSMKDILASAARYKAADEHARALLSRIDGGGT